MIRNNVYTTSQLTQIESFQSMRPESIFPPGWGRLPLGICTADPADCPPALPSVTIRFPEQHRPRHIGIRCCSSSPGSPTPARRRALLACRGLPLMPASAPARRMRGGGRVYRELIGRCAADLGALMWSSSAAQRWPARAPRQLRYPASASVQSLSYATALARRPWRCHPNSAGPLRPGTSKIRRAASQ